MHSTIGHLLEDGPRFTQHQIWWRANHTNGRSEVARRVFYSFHYQLDNWRVQQVMNMGVVEGQPLLGSQRWEDVARGGDAAIQSWIDEQMKYKSCDVVLIGSQTAGRRWVEYEIRKAWGDKKGVVGIYIHRLHDKDGKSSSKGANPFSRIKMTDGKTMDAYVKTHDPAGLTSGDVYNTIKNNIEKWVEDAIAAR